MSCFRVLTDFRLLFFAIFTAFAASTAQAQNKNDIADACIAAIEAGDMDKAKQIASAMMDWRTMFGTATIRKAEQCLERATGEYWKYFITKGRFLSEGEARAEQEFIDGTADRKLANEQEEKRLICEVTVATNEVTRLEEEYESIKNARAMEALRATIDACSQIYETDQAAALLEPVCNDVFTRVGVPDTKYAFDFRKLEEARIRLALSTLELRRSSFASPSGEYSESSDVTKCKELLAD